MVMVLKRSQELKLKLHFKNSIAAMIIIFQTSALMYLDLSIYNCYKSHGDSSKEPELHLIICSLEYTSKWLFQA